MAAHLYSIRQLSVFCTTAKLSVSAPQRKHSFVTFEPMSFRKFKADKIFTGTEMLGADHVLITDENGRVLDLVSDNSAGDEIEQFSGTLSPGFINCHCHLELSHMKGL